MPPPTELPPLSPQTLRIHEAAERLARAAPLGSAREDLPVFRPELDTEPAAIEVVDGEPAHMLRLKATEAPRMVDRPDAIEDQIREVTPQFFLRNTSRTERAADPEWMDWGWRRFAPADRWSGLDEARSAGRAREEAPPLASTVFAIEVASRRDVVLEARWHERFGRPDPVDAG